MNPALAIMGFGFLLGIKHAFDADHIAAVSTIVSGRKSIKKSSLIGMFWGFGHTISLLFIGFIVLLLGVNVPKDISLYFEIIAGLMLVFLGASALIAMQRNKVHFHVHKHGGKEHIHFHSHKLAESHKHEHKSLAIGLVHGMAGSAALTILALTTVKSVFLGLGYILIFGVGSIAGMSLISGMITLPFTLFPNKFEITRKILKIGAGLSSVIIGLSMLI